MAKTVRHKVRPSEAWNAADALSKQVHMLRWSPPEWRSTFLMVVLFLLFSGLVARAWYLQVGETRTFLQARAEARYARSWSLEPQRGALLDRRGKIMALSVPVTSFWMDTTELDTTAKTASTVQAALGLTAKEWKTKIGNRTKTFVYLRRHIRDEQASALKALRIKGVYDLREFQRVYPGREETAHWVGRVNLDGQGIDGLEKVHDKKLKGLQGERTVLRNRSGEIIADVKAMVPAKDGTAMDLSVDLDWQHFTFDALRSAVVGSKALAGGAVLIDAKTGEILALANYPSFDPNAAVTDIAQLRNRVVSDIYEPGSIMKPFSVGAALDQHHADSATLVNVTPGSLVVGKKTIADVHNTSTQMTVAQVLATSSNVGTVRLAMRLEPTVLGAYLEKAGFATPTVAGFPGEARSLFRDPKTWKEIEQATIAYGHGISVSLMQMARAYTVFANAGHRVELTAEKKTGAADRKTTEVFSKETADAVRTMLIGVTGPDGTAQKASIPGYTVAGKTGTALKLANGHYINKYVASFVGMVPATNPRYIMAVMVDEPGYPHYGGTVAAPVFKKVMTRVLYDAGVPYDQPTDFESPTHEAIAPALPVSD